MTILYSDDFNGDSRSANWVNLNSNGDWVYVTDDTEITCNGGIAFPVAYVLINSFVESFPVSQVVSCLVSIDTLDQSGSSTNLNEAGAGVTLAGDGTSVSGTSFGFAEDENTIAWFYNGTMIGSASYTWNQGLWYWFKLKYDSVTNTFYAKVYMEGSVEPNDWTFSWSGSYTSGSPAGQSAGIVGGIRTLSHYRDFTVETVNPDYNGTASLSINGVSSTITSIFNIPLVIDGTSSNTYSDGPHGFNLFLKQSDVYKPYYAPSPPMFVRGTTGVEFNNKDNPLPLYMNGFVYKINKPFNLFICNYTTPSTVPLIIAGDIIPSNRSYNSTVLNINGFFKFNANTPLIIHNNTGSVPSTVTLFISGPRQLNSNPVPFFVGGDQFKPFNHPLTYMYLWAGDRRCETLGMFLQASPVSVMPFSVPILIGGSTLPGNYLTVPLNIIGSGFQQLMNLVIKGKDEGGTSSIIRLIITGGNSPVDNKTPLVLFNNNGWSELDTPFFVKGDGVNMDYLPFNGAIGFHIQRGPQNGISLVMWHPGSDGTVPFHIIGAPSNQSSLPILITGFGDELNLTAPLYLYGDVFSGVNGTCTLVMPEVVGFVPESADLYTNGFRY